MAPVEVTGRREPLPTTIEEGTGYRGGEVCERVPALEVMFKVAPESKYQSCYDTVAASWY